MPYNRFEKAIEWFALKTKMNVNHQSGRGHFFLKGTIVNVFFGENVGYEKSGQRPALIVSTDNINRNSGNVIVVPLTKIDNKRGKPLLHTQYVLKKSKYKLTFDSVIQCEDVRCVSKERLGSILDKIDKYDAEQVEKRLKYTFSL